MRVNVARNHILLGTPRKTENCAIALALRDLVVEDVLVCVTDKTVIFTVIDHEDVTLGAQQIAKLPFSAELFVQEYDNEGKEQVRPFQFELNIPETVLRTEIRQRRELERIEDKIREEQMLGYIRKMLDESMPELVGAEAQP